ncbi:MAG: hypothetical protein KGN40_07410 [Burkholderiales bacterium]|jgi:hypothetical protein|nr:hypothetical protein [Burkholderiales bacterium]
MSKTLQPFENESASLTIDALTIENRIDQIEMYGSLAITRDKIGLGYALQLKQILDNAVSTLQNDPALPEQITFKPSDQIDNPFK